VLRPVIEQGDDVQKGMLCRHELLTVLLESGHPGHPIKSGVTGGAGVKRRAR
jgi:hypothetical protein